MHRLKNIEIDFIIPFRNLNEDTQKVFNQYKRLLKNGIAGISEKNGKNSRKTH